MSYIRLDNSD